MAIFARDEVEIVGVNLDRYEEFKEAEKQRDELLEVAKYSLEIVESLPCECDTYSGHTCNKHNWKRKLEKAIQKPEGDIDEN